MATEERASGGQPENQSIVQQVTNAGNCLRRARNISPNGLQSGSVHVELKIFIISV